MFAHRSHRQVEMTAGPLLPNVLAFTVPLILSGVLQLLYNSADIIVVGRFADSVAMASVGATTSLIQLLVSMLMGLSVGASVAVARATGAGDRDGVRCAVIPIILGAAARLKDKSLTDKSSYVLAALALLVCTFTGVNKILVVLGGAAFGLITLAVQRGGKKS